MIIFGHGNVAVWLKMESRVKSEDECPLIIRLIFVVLRVVEKKKNPIFTSSQVRRGPYFVLSLSFRCLGFEKSIQKSLRGRISFVFSLMEGM